MHDLPARPPRDQRLDIVRGWLQLSIFATHAGGTFIGGWMIHAAWGLSDSSELFVFLSGFTLGSVYARKAARGGWREAAVDLLVRTRRLYRMHLMVVVLFGAMVAAAAASVLPGEAGRLGWTFLVEDPARAVPGLLSMTYQPDFMGILPVFVWCMLLLPGFAAALGRFGASALAGPLACYAAVWTFGLAMPSLQPGGRIEFNPFAWQLLFLAGAYLGRRALLHGEALPFRAGRARGLLWAALAVLAAVLLMRLEPVRLHPLAGTVRRTPLDRGQVRPGAAAAAARAGARLRGGRPGAARCALDAPRRAAGDGADRPVQPGGVLPRPVPLLGGLGGFSSRAGAWRRVRGRGCGADRAGLRGAGRLRRPARPAARDGAAMRRWCPGEDSNFHDLAATGT